MLSHSHGGPSAPTAWSRGRVLAPARPSCPSSTHQGPGRVLGCPVAQLTLQLHVLCAPRHIPGQGNAVGLEGDGLDALQGWGVQLGCRRAGESWGGVWWAVSRAMTSHVPVVSARSCSQGAKAKNGGNHPKTFRRMAGVKGQELVCAPAWGGVMQYWHNSPVMPMQRKTDSMVPGTPPFGSPRGWECGTAMGELSWFLGRPSPAPDQDG